MNVLYIISTLILFVTVILFKKSDKKINFFGSLLVTSVAFMCYQAIIAYFMNLIRIPITLLNVSIVNIIIIITLWLIICLKIKQFQKYTVKKADILFIIVLLVVNIPILFKEFGLFQNFRYISTDAVLHCQAAMAFSKSDFLLESLPNWEAMNPTFMIASYVNDGLLMKALVEWMGEFNLYKVYMFTDISYYLMIGYVFYLLLTSSKKCDTKLKYILAYIISIIFMIGYPLNSLITGFHYFSLSILEIITIIYIIKNWYSENRLITCVVLFLINTGIMFTYNLFAPIIYLSEFIYFVYKIKSQKEKLISKSNLFGLLMTFIIPGLIGLAFFILPRMLGNTDLQNQQQLWLDGYIYTNFWSNLILFIPFALYYIFKVAKENKLNIEIITFFVIIIYTLLFFLGLAFKYVSVYYLMKPYCLLSAIILLLFFKSLCIIIDNLKIGKIISISVMSLYCIVLIINLLFVNVGAYDFQKYNEGIGNLFDIYNSNKAIMKYIQKNSTDDRMEALKYIHENHLIKNQNLLYLGTYTDNFLFKMFFTYENREGIDKPNVKEHIHMWNNGEYEYLVIFLKEESINHYSEDLELENGKVIFETENCAIYQYEK